MAEVSRMATKRLYRSRKSDILGVCHGIAEWRDLPVGGVQLAAILIAVCTAIVPALLVYLIIGIILPVNPEKEGEKSYSRKAYHADSSEYETVYDDMRQKARDAEESYYRTRDKEAKWDDEFNKN